MLRRKRAVYSHCYGHALNLAIGTTIKQSTVCSDAMCGSGLREESGEVK